MKNTYFTGDWHLGHANIIKYLNRPFYSVGEMNDIIISNFYNTIKLNAVVYFIGDLSFDKAIIEDFFAKLPKNIHFHFISGNHDKKTEYIVKYFVDSYSNMKDIKINGNKITLCHYAMRVWNCSHFNSWQLYGHSHGTLNPIGKQCDVGVDNWNFYPVSFEQIKEYMNKQPDNFNLVKK